jgi:hypothetical protein
MLLFSSCLHLSYFLDQYPDLFGLLFLAAPDTGKSRDEVFDLLGLGDEVVAKFALGGREDLRRRGPERIHGAVCVFGTRE